MLMLQKSTHTHAANTYCHLHQSNVSMFGGTCWRSPCLVSQTHKGLKWDIGCGRHSVTPQRSANDSSNLPPSSAAPVHDCWGYVKVEERAEDFYSIEGKGTGSGILSRAQGRDLQTADDFYSIEGMASQRRSRRGRQNVWRCGSHMKS